MDIRKICEEIALSRGYRKVRSKHYVRSHQDIFHLLHLNKGTWSRTHQLDFSISVKRQYETSFQGEPATIQEWGAPCDEPRKAAYEALSFDSLLDEQESRKVLERYFDCIDTWMFSFGGRATIRTWLEGQDGYFIEPTFVTIGCYDELGVPRPTKVRQRPDIEPVTYLLTFMDESCTLQLLEREAVQAPWTTEYEVIGAEGPQVAGLEVGSSLSLVFLSPWITDYCGTQVATVEAHHATASRSGKQTYGRAVIRKIV